LAGDSRGGDRNEIARLRSELEQLTGNGAPTASPLDRLAPDRRAFYEEMFSLIYECSANRSAAKSLVDRIMSKVA
jgi:molecular chaperone HtpG